MLEDTQNVYDSLVKVLDNREAEVLGCYWLIGGKDDQGESYCLDCIRELKPNAEYGEDYEGGMIWGESDSCEHCEECGKLLCYTLTDYGVRNELDHFVDTGLDWRSHEECFELARIAHGIVSTDEDLKGQLFDVMLEGMYPPKEVTDYKQSLKS